MSQLILFDKNFREIGPVSLDLDAEFGTSKDSKNDFVIKTHREVDRYEKDAEAFYRADSNGSAAHRHHRSCLGNRL